MSVPVPRLKKSELIWLYNHRCREHGHRYIEHYSCYEHEIDQEKIGFLDIEASNLKANFGILLSYCIKIRGKDEILSGCITEKDLRSPGILDKRIVAGCIGDMRKFDRLVGHYSAKFDVPFLRTRALMHGIDFPAYGEIKHTDTYYMARRLLCLNSNRQGVVGEALLGEDIKTRIDPKHWILALQGNKEALDYILDHNKRDVCQLEGNYEKMVPFTQNIGRSI